MKVIVVGGSGNFGARIVRALRGDPSMALITVGRRKIPVPGAEDVPCALLDIAAPTAVDALRTLAPALGLDGPAARGA